jgi:hypothetical protein
MKVIILVLSARSEPYWRLENWVRGTWGSIKQTEVDIFYYHGDGQENAIVGDTIYSVSLETMNNIGHKTLTAFDLIKDLEFDFLFRTNSSSYVRQDSLVSFLRDKPRHGFYCGIKGRLTNIDFCSGSGYLLSKDAVLKVLDNRVHWRHDLVDDVALGDLMNRIGVGISDCARRLDVNELGRPYCITDLWSHYHIRCACHHDRRLDIMHMKTIHRMLYGGNCINRALMLLRRVWPLSPLRLDLRQRVRSWLIRQPSQIY